MVLEIPGGIFGQQDVRETPAATATATAVGLTDEPYVLVSAGGADLTAERVLTAGEGIDLADGGAGTTITVSGEDATSANKGIAKFDATDFLVSTGDVTLVVERIQDISGPLVASGGTKTGIAITYQDATGDMDFVVNNATALGNLSGTNSGDDPADDTAYNATSWNANTDAATKNAIRDKFESLPAGHAAVTLNANATAAGLSLSTQEINYRASTNAQTGYATAAQITAQEANTTHKSSDGSDHSLIANKTSYVSKALSGTDRINSGERGNIQIPNGAVITAAIVTADNVGTDNWTLKRRAISNGAENTLATAAVNTADTSISNATVDTSTYSYYFEVIDSSGITSFFGAKITYTTDYI